MTDLIDLSHTVVDGMITYKGLPGPVISDFISHRDSEGHYAEGTCFHIGKIEMVANTGTYLDAPFHRFPSGADISQLPLESLANLKGLVFRTGDRVIGPELFEGADLRGKAVLIHTGWDRNWGKDAYFKNHPHLTRQAAEVLISGGVHLVGIDSLNIDSTSDGERPVHTLCLKAGIPIVEHLCAMDALPETGFRFFAVPVKAKGVSSFPVRAFAMV